MSIRISYSLLKTYETKSVDDVVNLYLRLDGPQTEAMKRGSDFDRKTREYIKDHKTLPPELGGKKLSNPISDKELLKFTVPFGNYTLSAELDTLDSPAIYEFKSSSVKDSADYSNDYQVDFYFLVADLLGLAVDRAYIFRQDAVYLSKYDSGLVWKSPSRIENIKERIATYGPQIEKILGDYIFDKK